MSFKVFIIDPHPVILAGLERVFASQPDLIITGMAMNAQEAVGGLSESCPDILVVDPCYLSFEPLALLQTLHVVAPSAAILLYLTNDDTILAERSLKEGVKGYLLKSDPVDLLLEVIRHIASGGIFYSARLIERMMRLRFSRRNTKGGLPERRLEILSVREQQVFEMMGQGMNSYKIAERLLISPKTINVHKANIRQKLHLKSSRLVTLGAIKWLKSLKTRD